MLLPKTHDGVRCMQVLGHRLRVVAGLAAGVALFAVIDSRFGMGEWARWQLGDRPAYGKEEDSSSRILLRAFKP